MPYNEPIGRTSDADKLADQKEHDMAYTLDSKVGELLKDAGAVKILEKYAPNISKNPLIGFAKGMSLKTVVSMPQARDAGLTEEMVTKVLAEINVVQK
jgi:hypothetical protein